MFFRKTSYPISWKNPTSHQWCNLPFQKSFQQLRHLRPESSLPTPPEIGSQETQCCSRHSVATACDLETWTVPPLNKTDPKWRGKKNLYCFGTRKTYNPGESNGKAGKSSTQICTNLKGGYDGYILASRRVCQRGGLMSEILHFISY